MILEAGGMAGQWESGRAVVRVWGQQLEAEAVGKGVGPGVGFRVGAGNTGRGQLKEEAGE